MFSQNWTKATDGHFAPRHTNTYCISPYFMTTAQDGGKVVSLTPQEIHLVLISVRG